MLLLPILHWLDPCDKITTYRHFSCSAHLDNDPFWRSCGSRRLYPRSCEGILFGSDCNYISQGLGGGQLGWGSGAGGRWVLARWIQRQIGTGLWLLQLQAVRCWVGHGSGVAVWRASFPPISSIRLQLLGSLPLCWYGHNTFPRQHIDYRGALEGLCSCGGSIFSILTVLNCCVVAHCGRAIFK